MNDLSKPAKLSPKKQLENLYDALAESITNASPEEITAEMTPEDVVKAQELKAKMLEWVDEYKVIEWLRERHANCLSIAAQKTGEDRGGWMEDAKNFEATIRLCVKRVAQPMPAFDCHFSDIRPYLQHRATCRIVIARPITLGGRSLVEVYGEDGIGCTCGRDEVLAKYGRKA